MPNTPRYALGIDFGTESARTVLVEVSSGRVVETALHPYRDGVIDRQLPSGTRLGAGWALQNPNDWLAALETTIPAVLHEAAVPPESVIGVGIDFTACTVLTVSEDGTPLCELPEFRKIPHAWPLLWKHHAAQPQADRINAVAAARSEPWLARYGGRISAEWLLPKALQVLEQAPEVYHRAAYFVEAADWVVWQLTEMLGGGAGADGAAELIRNACTAGYKACWHRVDGYPAADFLRELHPDFGDLYAQKLAGEVVPPGRRVGGVSPQWARKLRLHPGTPVAAGIIDAHAAAPGGGVTGPGEMFLIMGTSTCHLLMSEREVAVEGISGVVEDGILPGLYGYEAGQASVGDTFAWFVRSAVPPDYHQEAAARGVNLHRLLSEKAALLRPGESGLLALDWFNGCRSVLVDGDLSGLLLGLTLATRPEEIYRALIEATAFGTRVIIEAFEQQGLPVERVRAGGGLVRNELVMQLYADILGREIRVSGTSQTSALGAAMLGAVAAGPELGGYPDLAAAARKMAAAPGAVYTPNAEHAAVYDALYQEYRRLYDHFGRGENNVMKTLRALRHPQE